MCIFFYLHIFFIYAILIMVELNLIVFYLLRGEMNKFVKVLLAFLSASVLGFVIGALLVGYLTNGVFSFEIGFLVHPYSFFGAVVLDLLLLVFYLNKMTSDKVRPTDINRGVTTEGKEVSPYFNARLITLKELRTDPVFNFSYFKDLKHKKIDGVPIRAERIGNQTEINIIKPIHTLIIGTTGSGKTTMVIEPTIQILSETINKPSMVISDPKGEIYSRHSQRLRNVGYNVQCIDLRNPKTSSRFNPIERAFDAFTRANNLINEVKIVKGPIPKNIKKIMNEEYGEEWYSFENAAFPNKKLLKQELDSIKQELVNLAYEDIQDVAMTLCPPSGNDPQWAQGAQDMLRALMMAMLDDSLIPELEMTREKFNLYNVSKIAGLRDTGSDSLETLKKYFEGRDPEGNIAKFANTVVATAAVTSKGYLSHVSQGLNMFDIATGALTSTSDLDFSTFADIPTALFIIIPDERATKYKLANMIISQLYTFLIERANRNPNIKLPRNVYFLLDEFGNLPKIEKLKNYITAGRSRGIYLMLVIQDYTQLGSVYGDNDAATIKNNCNIHIYVGTKDAKTREEFSKNAGEYAVKMTSKSTNISEGTNESKGSRSSSLSERVERVPLISANELDHLKKFEVVINAYGQYSMRTIFTPYYVNPDYKIPRAPDGHIVGRPFDEHKIYYDIKKRNKIVLKDDDGDDDFDFSKFGKND